MEEKDIERLIDKKVAEAKLDISEKRLRLFLYFGSAALALFGVIIPLFSVDRLTTKVESALDKFDKTAQQNTQQVNQLSKDIGVTQKQQFDQLTDAQIRAFTSSSSKVDNAIAEMRKEFKELAGNQLRKPFLECYVNGKSLEGALLRVLPRTRDFDIQIKNVGDAPARNLQLKLYIQTDITDMIQFFGLPMVPNDEPSYNMAFDLGLILNERIINPGYSTNTRLHIALDKVAHIPALLKVFHEGEPKKYTFSFEYKE